MRRRSRSDIARDGVTSVDTLFMRSTGQVVKGWHDRVKFNALHQLQSGGRSVFQTRQWNPEHPRHDVVTLTSRFDGEYRVAAGDECGGLTIIDGRKTYCRGCSVPLVRDPNAHKAAIFEVLWTHDSRYLVTGSGDKLCKVWDMTRPDSYEILHGHEASIKSIAQSPLDKDMFLTGSRDGRAILWDLRIGTRERSVHDIIQPFSTIPHSNHPLVSAQWSSKKRRLGPVAKQIKSVTGVAFTRGHNHIVTSGSDGKLHFWDTRMLRGTRLKSSKPVAFATIDYCAVDDGVCPGSEQLEATTASPAKMAEQDSGLRRQKGISNLALSPDGTKLLVGVTNGTLYVHDVTDPSYSRAPRRYTGHQSHSYYIRARFSPDGAYILSGSTNRSAFIWETRGDGWPLLRLDGHTSEVNDVSMSGADPTLVATASDDNTVRLWGVRNGGQDQTEPCTNCGQHSCCWFSSRRGRTRKMPRWKEEEVEEPEQEDFAAVLRRMGQPILRDVSPAPMTVAANEGPLEQEGAGGMLLAAAATQSISAASGRAGQRQAGEEGPQRGRRTSGSGTALRQSSLRDLWGKRPAEDSP